jgi:glycosyltransferase involved in cell wall biosynthesis
MKKIICTVTNDLTYDQRMIRICSSLAGAGYEVLLVGRRKKSSIPLQERTFQQKRLNCWLEKGKFFYIEYNIRLFFFLLFTSFDILNAVDLDTLLPGFLMTRLKRKKLVYDAHEYFTEVPEVVRRPRIQQLWEGLARFILPKLKDAYTVGPELARLMGEKYGLNFQVIRNVPYRSQRAVDIEKSAPPILLYQGVLNEGRGLEHVIEAMQQLDGPELWLAGEGDLSELLRTQVDQMQLTEKVKFLGYLPPEELARLTPKAFLGLNLLENKGLSYYYSLANKCFDYIQAGVPSLQMDFPEYRALNEEYGTFVLLKNLSPDTLVESIRQLINDPDRYRHLKNNCLKAREALNWDKEEEKLLGVYRLL